MTGQYEYLDSAAEERRLAAVRRFDLLDRPPEEAYQRVAFVAATLCVRPIATVTLVDSDRVWLAACHGVEGLRQLVKAPGLCATVINQDGVYVVTDARTDPRTRDHPLVRGELGLRFYAAAPIQTWDGYRLGTVNVIDRRPGQINDSQLRSLEYLASMVADELELRLLAVRSARSDPQR